MRSLVAEAAPLSCELCPIGRHAVYSPAFANTPNAITTRRYAQTVLPPKRTIFHEGEVPRRVYTLFSGWAYRYRTLPAGGRQILAFFIPGDFLAIQAMKSGPLACSVKALTHVVLCGFDREEFFEFLLRADGLRENLRREVLTQYEEAEEMLVDLGRRPAVSRVARFLLALEARLKRRGLSKDGVFELPIPQNLIADALGLTQVHVNRTLGIIRDSGAIEFRRNEMHIRGFEELKDLAEGR